MCFNHRRDMDPTEEFLHAMAPFARLPATGRQIVMQTADTTDDLKFGELKRIRKEFPEPITTEYWMMCEVVELQSTRRKARPLLADLPNHFIIGPWVVLIGRKPGHSMFVPDVRQRTGYIFPTCSRIFRPKRAT